jgi:hypothetical protein
MAQGEPFDLSTPLIMNTTVIESHTSRLSWRAILAGAVVALSVHLLLTTLGAGITSFIANPDHNDSPVQTMSLGVAISWTLSALISLWLGGCVAARIEGSGTRESGMMHGFVMWSAATVVAFVLLAAGVGKALGIAGQTAAGAAKAAAVAIPTIVQKSGEIIDQYSAEVTSDGKALTPAAKRRLATDLKNYLANGEGGRTQQNRDALVKTVAEASGMSPGDAGKTVDEWVASYDRAAAEVQAQVDAAAKKAREVAASTAKVTGTAAVWTFIAFWIGAVAAVWGGIAGATGCHKLKDKDYTATRVHPAKA